VAQAVILPNRNLSHCGWSKCDKGVYRGYHTPVEWEQHQSYVKIDLPPPIYPAQFAETYTNGGESYTQSDPQPQDPHYMVNTQPVVGSRKWQWLAVITMCAVWGSIVWMVAFR